MQDPDSKPTGDPGQDLRPLLLNGEQSVLRFVAEVVAKAVRFTSTSGGGAVVQDGGAEKGLRIRR